MLPPLWIVKSGMEWPRYKKPAVCCDQAVATLGEYTPAVPHPPSCTSSASNANHIAQGLRTVGRKHLPHKQQRPRIFRSSTERNHKL
eukprot:scaffold87873_cov17-Tisochrysis_lutea.AAC.1